MKMYEKADEELHTFLTSELDTGEWLDSCLATKVSKKTVNVYYQACCTLQFAATGEPVLI
jgi:hypothetical protein